MSLSHAFRDLIKIFTLCFAKAIAIDDINFIFGMWEVNPFNIFSKIRATR